jgi:hypothetical protein
LTEVYSTPLKNYFFTEGKVTTSMDMSNVIQKRGAHPILPTVTVTVKPFATGHGILPPLSRARIRRTLQKKIEQQQE